MKVLTVSEVADILKLHPRTVTKMARNSEIPATRIGRVWRFEEAVVLDWFNAQLTGTAQDPRGRAAAGHAWNGTTRVADLVGKETVQHTAERKSKQEVLEALAGMAVRTPHISDYQLLLDSLIEREEMCPTAVEGGLAFPHPRHPIDHLEKPVLSLLTTRYGVDFGAPDGAKTRLFVMVCSPDDRSHVKILSHLGRLFRPARAVSRLTRCHTTSEMLREIRRLEDALIQKSHSSTERR